MAITVNDQSFNMGAKGVASIGGFQVASSGDAMTSASIDSGDPSSHWQISSSGLITPTAAGRSAGLSGSPYSLSCTFNGTETATITGTAVANAWHANDLDELETVYEHADAALGDVFYLRGESGAGIDWNSSKAAKEVKRFADGEFSGTWTGSNWVEIKPEPGDTVRIWRWKIDGNSVANQYVKISGITWVTDDDASFGPANGVMRIANGASYIWITGCDDYSPDTYTHGNDFNFPILIYGSPALSNITITGNSFINAPKYDMANINGDNITVDDNDIGKKHNDGIKLSGTFHDSSTSFNRFSDVGTIAATYTIVSVTNGSNTVVTVDDATGISPSHDGYIDSPEYSQTRVANIASVVGNDVTLSYDSTGDSAFSSGDLKVVSIHGDFIQYVGISITSPGDGDNLTIDGNLMDQGSNGPSSFPLGQGILVRGSSVDINGVTARGNIYVGDAAAALLLDNCVDAVVENNVGLPPVASFSFLGGIPGLTMEGTSSEALIRNNIWARSNYGNTIGINEVAFDYTASADYASMFVSPRGYLSTASGSFASAWSVATDGPAFTYDPYVGAAGTGYIDYTAFTVSIPTDSTAPSLATMTPADGVSGVLKETDPTLTADEEIKFASDGWIGFFLASDDSLIERFYASADTGTSSGNMYIGDDDKTINFIMTSDWTLDSSVYALASGGAFVDYFDNPFAGLTSTGDWRFSVETSAAPTAQEVTNSGSAYVSDVPVGLHSELTILMHVGFNASTATAAEYLLDHSADAGVFRRTSDKLKYFFTSTTGTIVFNDTPATTYSNEYVSLMMSISLVGSSFIMADGSVVATSTTTATGENFDLDNSVLFSNAGSDIANLNIKYVGFFNTALATTAWDSFYATSTADAGKYEPLYEFGTVSSATSIWVMFEEASKWNSGNNTVGTATNVTGTFSNTGAVNQEVTPDTLVLTAATVAVPTLTQNHSITQAQQTFSVIQLDNAIATQDIIPSALTLGSLSFEEFTVTSNLTITPSGIVFPEVVFGSVGLVHEIDAIDDMTLGTLEVNSFVFVQLSQLDPDNRFDDVVATVTITYTDKIS